MKTRLIILVAVATLLSGCTTIKYKHPNGAEVGVTSMLNKRSISKAKFNPQTGAFELEGYSSEQTEVAAAVANAVAGALSPVK